MVAVLRHALDWIEEEGEEIEAMVLLQPTSPLRTTRNIDEAVEMFREGGADSVVSVVEVPHQYNPVSVLKMEDGYLSSFLPGQAQILRRQEKPKVYARNGPAVLVTRPQIIKAGTLYGGNTRGYIMRAEESVDVDEPSDLHLVELILDKIAR